MIWCCLRSSECLVGCVEVRRKGELGMMIGEVDGLVEGM